MTIPDYDFNLLEWGQIRNEFLQTVTTGALPQARYTVITRFGNNQLRTRLEFAIAQVRPLGPYALETQLVGQSGPSRTYGFGTGELLTILPPAFPGTVTFIPDTAQPE